ncbi:MAG: MarR family transcriptional regulator [Flavobacteriaceae bacterium]|nr:MarR family transcriptional regulator [Flavobacteriaceae bacterium]
MTSVKYAKLMTGIRKIVRAINLESKRVQKDLNISIPQLLTLKHLQDCADYKSTMKEIKGFLSLNASTVTGIVARLEQKGLIARLPDPKDKRSTPIILTSKGNDLLVRSNESLHERISKKLELIDDGEFSEIINSLETLIDLFNIQDVDASPIITGQATIEKNID